MAVSETPRHKLKKYSAGTDPHPSRPVHNAEVDKLEQLPAVLQGSTGSRPLSGVGKVLYWDEAVKRFVYDDGAEWHDVAPIGGVTPAAVATVGTANEGTSRRAARADHTHPLPLANASAPGAMSSADKTKLDASLTPTEMTAIVGVQVVPTVKQIAAEYVASAPLIIDAAAAAVDANPKIDELVNGIKLTTGKHLDEYTEPATYYQNNNTNATLELGYPVAKAGVLNIDNWGYSDGPLLMEQYWPYNHEGFFFRHVYYTSKTWKEIPTKTAVQSMINASAPALPPEVSLRSNVVTIGDSLTAGYSNGAAWGNAEKWPTILDGLLPAATTTNHGFTGHLIDGTMIMIGAHKPRFTIPGGVIPADGAAVTVTTAQVYGIPQGISAGGTLAGVVGALEHTNGVGFKFRSLSGVGATGLTGLHEFKSNRLGTWEANTVIIWLGRNDISNATVGMEATVPDHVVASTKRLVERLTPRVKQIMICGVTTRTTEETGSQQHTWVTEINDRLRGLFPEYFRSAQDFLRNEALGKLGITPTPTDTEKLAAGTIPPSVMGDETHISKATADAMARHFFRPFLTGKGYVD